MHLDLGLEVLSFMDRYSSLYNSPQVGWSSGLKILGVFEDSIVNIFLDSAPSSLVSASSQIRPPDPKFHFTDISTANLNGIVPHIVVNSGLNLTKDQPEVQQLIKVAIEKSIQVRPYCPKSF